MRIGKNKLNLKKKTNLIVFSTARPIRRCGRQRYISWQSIGKTVIFASNFLLCVTNKNVFFFFARIVVTVTLLAEHLGCYKMTLECKDKLIKFYTSLGYVFFLIFVLYCINLYYIIIKDMFLNRVMEIRCKFDMNHHHRRR